MTDTAIPFFMEVQDATSALYGAIFRQFQVVGKAASMEHVVADDVCVDGIEKLRKLQTRDAGRLLDVFKVAVFSVLDKVAGAATATVADARFKASVRGTMLTVAELAGLPEDQIFRLFRKFE